MTPDPDPMLCDYLDRLGVAHTRAYTERRVAEMPFRTLFGITKLLQEYGVESEGYLLEDRNEILKLQPPYLARTAGGFVIVTGTDSDSVSYITDGKQESMPLSGFLNVWSGHVLLSFPDKEAYEPDYKSHVRMDILLHAKKWVLLTCVAFLLLYAIFAQRLYASILTMWIAAVDIAGLYFTYLLVQKSAKISNPAADRVCGILEAHGCDRILEMKASKFFGLFGWSEVGFAYFSVSLIALLIYPECRPALALCNMCCLPFTIWSLWYQKFKARRWCTLCICVQTCLWMLFLGYAGGGWVGASWPPSVAFIILGASYITVMLTINALIPLIENNKS